MHDACARDRGGASYRRERRGEKKLVETIRPSVLRGGLWPGPHPLVANWIALVNLDRRASRIVPHTCPYAMSLQLAVEEV